MSQLPTLHNCDDIVEYLIKHRFSSLSYDDKIFVKNLKIPRPDLGTSLINFGKPGKSNRSFSCTWYDNKCEWLTGSKILNKLFCWPCVLFANSSEMIWWKLGYSDLKNLSRSTEKHTKSQVHISSNCKLHLLGKQNIVNLIDTAKKYDIEKFNNQVRENREILKRLIDACIFLCTQELPFRGHNESEDSFNKGKFRELILLMSKRILSALYVVYQ